MTQEQPVQAIAYGIHYINEEKVELNSLEEIEDFFAKNPNFEPDDMIMEDECHDCQCDGIALPKPSLMSRIKGFFKR